MTALVEKYRPKTLAEFVGIERPRALLTKFAEKPYESAWLLLGPSGLGKTTIALALAEAIGGDVHHIPSRKCDIQAVDEVCHMCHYIPLKGQWHIILCDEADQMSRPAQLAFLSKLDTTAAPPKTIFLFTANATSLLEDRFLSRCRKVAFDTEGMLEPGTALLKNIWQAESTAPHPDFRAIMRDSGCNIRRAIMDLEMELIAPTQKSPAPLPVIRSSGCSFSYDQRRYRAIRELKAKGLIDKTTPNNRVPKSLWGAYMPTE